MARKRERKREKEESERNGQRKASPIVVSARHTHHSPLSYNYIQQTATLLQPTMHSLLVPNDRRMKYFTYITTKKG